MGRLPLVFLIAVAIGLTGCGPSEPTDPAPQTEMPAASEISTVTERPTTEATEDIGDATDSETGSVTRVDKTKTEALVKETDGKVLVVNVWATWCLPCIAEMPHLVSFYKDMDAETTAFLSLSADGPRFIDEAVVPFVAEHKLPFPVYALDFDDPDPLILAAILGVEETGWDGALPATFLIDRDGMLVKHWFEEIKPGALEAAVAEAVGSS